MRARTLTILLGTLLLLWNTPSIGGLKQSAATGNWNNAATWSPASVPAAGDSILIQAGHTVTLNVNGTCGALNIIGTLGYSANNGRTLTVVSGSGHFGDVIITGTLNFNTNANQTLTLGGNLACTGTINNNSGGASGSTFIFNGTGSKTVGSTAAFRNITMNNASLTVRAASALSISTNFTLTAGTFHPNGNLVSGTGTNTLSVTGTLIVDAQSFSGSYSSWETRTLNAGSTVSYMNDNPTIDATLTYRNLLFGGLGIATSSGNLVIQGNFSVTGGGTANFGARDVTISGAAPAQNIDRFSSAGALTCAKTAGIATLTSAVSAAALVINGVGGTLNLGSALTHTISSNVTLTAGTLDAGSCTLNVRGNWSGASTFLANTGTVDFNGPGAQTLPTTSTTFSNLEISGSGSKTLGSPITINGSLTIDNGATLEDSGFQVTSAGTLNLNDGTLRLGSALVATTYPAFTTSTMAVGTTVEYASGLPQTVSAAPTYQNLVVSGAGTKSALGGLTVDGNFAIGPGGTFDAGTFGHTIRGNLVNDGTFTPSTSTITLNGTSPQTLGGSNNLSLNNLTISNSSGIDLTADVSVNGALNFTAGNITTGVDTVIISSTGSVSRTSGHVVGNLQKYVATGATSLTYEIGDAINYSPVVLAFGNVTTPGTVTATSTPGEHPNISTSTIDSLKSVNRYWTVTNGGTTFDSCDATFGFVPGDLDSVANPNNCVVQKYSDPMWSTPTVGTRTATSTQATGLMSFSDFAIGEIRTYAITASAGANGSISPSGVVTVNHGADITFTITADVGYHVDSVFVDGAFVGQPTSYTFTNVTASHTIGAQFAINTYAITALAGPNGSISPSGVVTVTYGTDTTFTITPDVGYHIDSVFVDGSFIGQPTSYTFTNVTASHTISAQFAINTYTITASAGSNGSISPPGVVTVNYGSDTTFTITPDAGYHIDSVFVDGGFVGQPTSYTFTNVTASHTISAQFAINMYTITASAGPNGSISPSGVITVNYGSDTTFTITPDAGYHIDSVFVDGSFIGQPTSYTFTNVTVNHTVSAQFAINTYTISAAAGANGTIFPTGVVVVNYGTDTTFTITPDVGYHIDSVFVDGSFIGQPTSYTFTNVTASHTISAQFAINTYTITASAGSNGSISPSGVITVNYGSDTTFTITPDAGYHIDSVFVDGSFVGQPTSYTFTNVTASHTISVQFAINMYTITASAGSNGSISPSGVITVNYGSDTTVTITPDVGYHIDSVFVDGSFIGQPTSYTFTNVTASHTISASFAINTYTITASAGPNGSISPSGVVTINHGADTTFTITPDSGYVVDSVFVDGASVGAPSSYQFANVTTNHTIAATFEFITSVEEAAPREFRVFQNYPNPFNPATSIKFSVEKPEQASVIVYDMLGQEVIRLFDDVADPGRYYDLRFEGTSLSSGVYFYRVVTESRSEVKKMLLMK